MIIGDTFEVPSEKTTLLRFTAEELEKNYRRRTVNLKKDGDGLVVAEGEEMVNRLPEMSSGIFSIPGKLFAHEPYRSRIYTMDLSRTYSNVVNPVCLLRYYNTKGDQEIYCVTKNDVLFFNNSAVMKVGEDRGGVCAAVFRERIFTANGERVCYSKALNGQDWSEHRYGAGYLELLSDEAGEILNMLPYKDKLYLMRRHGITALRVLGDELNFKAVHMPMNCGNLIANSAAFCGEKIGYLTDCGFYLFNGAVSVLADSVHYREIDLTKSVKAVSYRGKYYARVKRTGGDTAFYCYDPEAKEAHFIENGAVDVAVNDGVYYTRGTYVYRVTEKGIINNFVPYLTAEKIAYGLGEEKMLRSVMIEGEGRFNITLTSNRGSRTVKGSAGEELKLRSPLRGNGFNIKISVETGDADRARFLKLFLRITEESNGN